MPMSESDDEDSTPLIGHSQSDLFIYKQSVSDKMVADCVESLIGTYVYVSIVYNNMLFFFLTTFCLNFRNVELKWVLRSFKVWV